MTGFLSPCGTNGGFPVAIRPQEALALIGEHLGAQSDADPTSSFEIPQEGVSKNNAFVKSSTSSNAAPACSSELLFSCPALSLAHKDHLDMDHSSRKQAEHYAVSLLSRPLHAPVGETEGATSRSSEELGFACQGLPEVPAVLLRNIYESFAMLVDSRLRAYATFLARHGDTLARKTNDSLGVLSVEEKLKTLLGVGGQIVSRSMRTAFDVAEASDEDDANANADEKKPCSLPLRLVAVINLVVPGPTGEVDTLSVSQSTTGVISGLFTSGCSKPQEVHVKFDTKELLSSMMDQAARVVALVVDMTNRAFAVPEEPKLPRGDSYLVMPPPKSKPQKAPLRHQQEQSGNSGDKRKLDDATRKIWEGVSPSELPIVSPDLSALNSPHRPMPHLFLDYQQDGSDTAVDPVDDLSPDQCADVVDGVFGVVTLDDSIFMGPPAVKKLKPS